MKFETIEEGKKYWKTNTKHDSRTKKKEVTGVAVYVLKVDKGGMKVLASLNGLPPKWFGKNGFHKWKPKDPTSKKISQ